VPRDQLGQVMVYGRVARLKHMRNDRYVVERWPAQPREPFNQLPGWIERRTWKRPKAGHKNNFCSHLHAE